MAGEDDTFWLRPPHSGQRNCRGSRGCSIVARFGERNGSPALRTAGPSRLLVGLRDSDRQHDISLHPQNLDADAFLYHQAVAHLQFVCERGDPSVVGVLDRARAGLSEQSWPTSVATRVPVRTPAIPFSGSVIVRTGGSRGWG